MLFKNVQPSDRRRGVILMVVFALLTLFALIGVTFVLYASSEATSARVAREAENINSTGPTFGLNPDSDAKLFLGQAIYDLDDPTASSPNSAYSSIRGQSLSRLIYGWCDALDATSMNTLNDKAFNGTGRLHYTSALNTAPSSTTVPFAGDDAYMVNFTYWGARYPATDTFLRDPECYGTAGPNPWRTDPTQTKAAAGELYTGGFNVPYTYPDHQNFLLAMIRATDGKVMMPSFHRPWLFDPSNQGYPANPNWTNKEGKYLTCFVRPFDMDSTFPAPDANGLWVKNLINAPGGNDSGWIDAGAPIQTASDGTPYKALYAPLIIELDSKLNANVIGNILATTGGSSPTNGHASNQGWGPYEVNLQKLFNATGAPNEWQNIFNGNGGTPGRYGLGPNSIPGGMALPMSTGTLSRSWAPADMTGTQDPRSPDMSTNPAADTTPGSWTPALVLPPPNGTSLPAVPYQILPSFGGSCPNNGTGMGAGAGYGNGAPRETTLDGAITGQPNHPLIYNALYPQAGNRSFPASLMLPLLSYGQNNTSALSSDLFNLFPNNLFPQPYSSTSDAPALKRRNLVTVLSADIERSCMTPYIWDLNDTSATPTRYQLNGGYYPSGVNVAFPPLSPTPGQRNSTPTWPPPSPTWPLISTPPRSDFDVIYGNTWRSVRAALTKVDLNRKLTAYPPPDPTYGFADPNNPTFASPTPADTAILTQVQQAIADRQQLAQDIFVRLLAATGAMDPATLAANGYATTSPEYNAVRYLAQLAVNIVDYIDSDDYSTPLNWNPAYADLSNAGTVGTNLANGWVFGTELPRLVLNEIYAEYDNDKSDPGLAAMTPKATWYNVNVWTELMNPLAKDQIPFKLKANDNASDWPDTQAILYAYNPSISAGWENYQVVLAGYNNAGGGGTVDAAVMRNAGNVTGAPDYGLTSPATNIQNYYAGAAGTNPQPSITQDYVASAQPYPPTAPPTMSGVGQVNLATAPPQDFRQVTPNGNLYAATPAASGSNVINGGFYVLGPDANVTLPAAGAAPPNLPTSTVRPEMKFYVSAVAGNPGADPTGLNPPGATVLLRRLACPALPPNQPGTGTFNPAMPINPYITVDYVSVPGTKIYNNLKRAGDGSVPAPATNVYAAYGRSQPYAAIASQQIQQNPQTAVAATITGGMPPPANTFFRQNAHEDFQGPPPAPPTIPAAGTPPAQTLKIPFDWLVHLDRPLISPMELLHVSSFKPHELTQMFVQPDTRGGSPAQAFGIAYQHLTPWFDGAPWLAATVPAGNSARLYRFLEMATTKSLGAGLALGGRIPGKVNLNMVWDPEVFQALCDAQQANLFYGGSATPDSNVLKVFANMVPQRSPTSDGAGGYMPGGNDRPFWGYGVGAAAGGDALDPNSTLPSQFTTPTPRGLINTLLAPNLAGPPNNTPTLFDYNAADANTSPVTNPYLRTELLSKIHNSITTKSNVFAMFVTIGYFKVVDQSAQPYKLGAEMVTNDGQIIRHQFFAIVDRTQMQAFQTQLLAFQPPGPPSPPFQVGGGVINNVSNVGGNIQITSMNHGLQTGMSITISGVQPTQPPASAQAANNTTTNPHWTVNVIDANNFQISGSTGPVPYNTPYLGGGTWCTDTGLAAGGSITGATNASPIQITTSAPHGLSTNMVVGIVGVQGNTAANGSWKVTVVDATNFTIADANGNASTGNGTYTAGTGSWTACANLYNGKMWQVQPGMVLTYEPNSGGNITGATNASPIQITSPNHGLVTGQLVTITGVQGNTGANNNLTTPNQQQWKVNVVDANNFTIYDTAGNPSTGSGAYTTGGTWCTTNEETVVVQQAAGGNFVCPFRQTHVAGVQIISRGNPGPWASYDPTKDAQVVPFWAILN